MFGSFRSALLGAALSFAALTGMAHAQAPRTAAAQGADYVLVADADAAGRVALRLVDARRNQPVARASSAGAATAWGAGRWLGAADGRLGPYAATERGRQATLAVVEAYAQLIASVRGAGGDTGRARNSVRAAGPTPLRAGASADAARLRTLEAGETLRPSGVAHGPYRHVFDETGAAGWVEESGLQPAPPTPDLPRCAVSLGAVVIDAGGGWRERNLPAPNELLGLLAQRSGCFDAPGSPDAIRRERARRSFRGGVTSRAPDRLITAALAQIHPPDAREPRNGGSAVVLLASRSAQGAETRNQALCRALFRTVSEATLADIRTGARLGGEGDLEMLRPIYWLGREHTPGGARACDARVEVYDFPRRDVIARKFNLRDAGPYLVVEQHGASGTERVAAVIDLTRTRTEEFDAAVAYFRDGFIQHDDIWRPDSYAPVAGDGVVLTYRGGAPAGFLPQLLRAAGAAACPLANLFDVCLN